MVMCSGSSLRCVLRKTMQVYLAFSIDLFFDTVEIDRYTCGSSSGDRILTSMVYIYSSQISS
jgi:hypothetical protein